MSKTYRNYIDGQWVEGNGKTIQVLNPATDKPIAEVPDGGAADVDRAVAAAKKAQPAWEKLPAIQRANHMRQITAKIRANAERLARTLVLEQGKVPELAAVEIEFAASYIDYMAEWARRIEGEIVTSDRPGEQILVYRKPIGVVAGILPWNFPFFLIARKLGPALVTGNTIVIKPSEETPINAFEFAELVAETDLPPGVFNLVCGGRETGAKLTDNKDVGLVSFTGSGDTGSKIMQACGKHLTRVNLELGGKAPAIVLADCDVDLTANALFNSRVLNTGQACNAAERVYVERKVADALAEKVTKLMAGTKYGDPSLEKGLHMGPLVTKVGRDKMAAMVEAAKGQGAQVLTGGKIADKPGYHYEPTVLLGCNTGMDVMTKEVFGPVLPMQVVDDLDEALVHANNSDYGLTSSIFTSNINQAMKAVRELRFGETYINREHFEAMQGFHAGRRKSGIGGADGKHGLYEHMETHVVYMQTAG
ncbi:aldehyde dehydrogenase [Variovorax sp. J22R133]|uniref:aldehyde dehydrogenase n=1 Tax=Variovorax brevis TaxID=3053503 RepID=UPI00257747DF|nr:aldehyde dehydrogenase [Variovorax sp. J22R133]MDM0117779.1 aldehyde dehydrogenase [Variovorax sp. J22R133]